MNFKAIWKVGVFMLLVSFLGMNLAFAQISLGPEIALPIGDFSTVTNTGFGASIRYDQIINDNVTWTVSAGYLSFGYKNVSTTTSMIPINGGIKYYFEGGSGFYGAADLGLFFKSTTISGVAISETKFGLSPGFGYRMDKFDFAGRFNILSDANYFNIRIAYVFPSK